MTYSFPNGFLWGTATAAHQVEGGTWNNDWWAFEHTPGSGCVERIDGTGCDPSDSRKRASPSGPSPRRARSDAPKSSASSSMARP